MVTGNGTLPAATDYTAGATTLALGDLDGDGKADIVGGAAYAVQVLRSQYR